MQLWGTNRPPQGNQVNTATDINAKEKTHECKRGTQVLVASLRKTVVVLVGFTLESIVEPDVDVADHSKEVRGEVLQCSEHSILRTEKKTRSGEVRRRREASWAHASGLIVASPMMHGVLEGGLKRSSRSTDYRKKSEQRRAGGRKARVTLDAGKDEFQ